MSRCVPTFQLKAYSERRGLVAQTPPLPCRSFVQQFLQLLYLNLQNTGTTFNITQRSGIGVSQSRRELMLMAVGAGRNGASLAFRDLAESGLLPVETGIVVGTGTNAVVVTDFALQTPIADGTASGQLEYLSCGVTNYRIVGSTGSFDVERLFRNSSGGSITINEIALYVSTCDLNPFGVQATETRSFCMIRDLVSPGFSIGDALYLRAIFTLSFTA